jgi:hypothetical protein
MLWALVLAILGTFIEDNFVFEGIILGLADIFLPED